MKRFWDISEKPDFWSNFDFLTPLPLKPEFSVTIWYMQVRSTYYGLASSTKSKKSNEAFLRYFPKTQFPGWFSVQFWPFDPSTLQT